MINIKEMYQMMTLNSNVSNTITCTDVNSASISNYATTSYGITSVYDSIQSTIDAITKKPDVRPDQRSALEVTRNRVIAKYYKDGFYTGSQDLIPAIKEIEVFNENTIKVTFMNGNTQTATVQNGDPYFFEDGLLRCLVKEMIGKEGTAILSKLLSYATDFYNKAEADKKKKAEEEATILLTMFLFLHFSCVD